MAAAYVSDPCLERLTNLTTINIIQKSAGGYNGCSYEVLNKDEVLFNLVELNPSHSFFAAGSRRAFNMDGVDNTGRKLFTIRRPLMFNSDKMEIYMNNAKAGVIRMARTLRPIFRINDAQDCPILRAKGSLSEPFHFKLQTTTKTDIGAIDKKWLGWGRELTSLKNNYVVTFPADLATFYKVAVIVTCIFIDFRYFEGK